MSDPIRDSTGAVIGERDVIDARRLRLEYTRTVIRINELTVIIDELHKVLRMALGEERASRLMDIASREGERFVADRRAQLQKAESSLYETENPAVRSLATLVD